MNNHIYYILAIAIIVLVSILILIISKRNKKPNNTLKKDVSQRSNISLNLKLSKTKSNFLDKIVEVIRLKGKVDEDLMDDLEEVLLQADVGVNASVDIIDELREIIKEEKISSSSEVQVKLISIIKNLMLKDYSHESDRFKIYNEKPFIVLFTGVNGVGKTTTIGKLAKRYSDKGKKVMLIAADTFRAAASEQLTIWAERSNAIIVKQQSGADPSSVVYDGVMSAVNKKIDIVFIDTAGRQHTKVNLMKELSKIERTIKKIVPSGPHETLMVIDSTTGQNALIQVEEFTKATDLSGLVLTKLDGTAKGGIVVGIKHQLNIPVKFIGVGEGINDLKDFDVEEFVEAIFQ